MSKSENLILIRLLRYQGRIDPRRLEDVLSGLKGTLDSDSLFEELIKAGLVDITWAQQARRYLRDKSRKRLESPEALSQMDRRFGQIALARGWINVGQLEEAILEQQRLRRVNLRFRIGEILVRSAAMAVDQVREVLQEQGYAARSCRECGAVVNLPQLVEAEAEKCPFCQGDIAAAAFLEAIECDKTP